MNEKIDRIIMLQAIHYLKTVLEDTLKYWVNAAPDTMDTGEHYLDVDLLEHLLTAQRGCAAVLRVQGLQVSEKQVTRFKLAIEELNQDEKGYFLLHRHDLHIDADILPDLLGNAGRLYVRLLVGTNILMKKCGAAARKNIQKGTINDIINHIKKYGEFFENEVLGEDYIDESRVAREGYSKYSNFD